MLDDLARIEPTTRRVSLAVPGAAGTFGILGLDAQGNSAPIEPSDVRLDYDKELFDVRDDGRGSFTVSARTAGSTAGRVTATAGV